MFLCRLLVFAGLSPLILLAASGGRTAQPKKGPKNAACAPSPKKQNPDIEVVFDAVVQLRNNKRRLRLSRRRLKLPRKDGNFDPGISPGWIIELAEHRERTSSEGPKADKVIWRHWVPIFSNPVVFPYDADICAALSPREIYLIVTFRTGFTIYKIDVGARPRAVPKTFEEWWKLTNTDTGAVACGPPFGDKLRKVYGPSVRFNGVKIRKITARAKTLSIQCAVSSEELPVATFTYDITKRRWKWLEDFK